MVYHIIDLVNGCGIYWRFDFMGTILTKEKAFEIISEFKDEIIGIDSVGVLAIYLIGSLGGGYYRPGQSDTVIIVKDDALISQKEIEEIADKYCQKYSVPKGFGAVVIQEKELFPPYVKSEIEEFEFSIEIARLKTQGLLFYGQYSLNHVPMPTKDHLLKDALIMEKWLYSEFGYPMYDKLSVTACINCILGTMRRFLMIEKYVFEFNKFETIKVYLDHSPDIIDEKVFSFIDSYLRGEVSENDENLAMLREFGTKITDYYNGKLLGIMNCR